MYGVIIVTFLGAVHWGVALATPLTSPIALRMANNAYVYSVLPSLVAWPVATMEPGTGPMRCYSCDAVCGIAGVANAQFTTITSAH